MTFIADYWSKSEIILYCKREDFEKIGKEHAFLLLNHSTSIDWIVSVQLLRRFNSFESFNAITKDAAKFIPVLGWYLWLSMHIFLKRSFEEDKKILEEGLTNYMKHPKSLMILYTPEGTRFTKEKHVASIEFAKKRNIEAFKFHLIPRPKGFASCVSVLKKFNCPIYNVQIAHDKKDLNRPEMQNFLLGRKIITHLYLERIPIENIEPTFECVHDIFKQKDALQESFNNLGNFYDGRGVEKIEGIKLQPNKIDFNITMCWILIQLIIVMLWTIKLILAGKLMTLVSVSTIICVVCKLNFNLSTEIFLLKHFYF